MMVDPLPEVASTKPPSHAPIRFGAGLPDFPWYNIPKREKNPTQ
jgi:hypothetical protein